MKLTVGVIILFVFQATAAVSQNMVASIHANNMELDRVFSEIEKQTSVKFLYRYENIAGKQVSVNAEDRVVDEILEMILRGQGLSYSRMSNNLIVISPVESLQSKKIAGSVTDESGSSLPGVSIVIKGTTQGTVTDMDGKFNLTVTGEQKVLVFSFIGYTTQEVMIGNQSNFNVVMREEEHAIDEVVVTALGIVRSKKTLTYATQEVNVNELSTNKDINLGNALAGKIAGVNVTASSGASGVSGDALIIIRGNRSISGENQPLIVIDGIPSSTGGGGLSGINTDDVQSINVLKGPSASALYGSAANNGVIVVTTKKGQKGKAQVEFNSSSNFDVPYLYPEFQNEYAQGANGNYSPTMAIASWGPKMTGQTVTSWTGEQVKLTPQPDNVKDLFRTGYNLVNSFSYSVGNEKLNAYFSYTNTNAQGVLEDNKMQRHNLNLRLGAELIKNLKMDFRITYHNREVKDKPVVGDDLFSPMFQLVKMPRSIRTADIEAAYYYDEAGSRQQLSWNPESTENVNPYWSMAGYENPSSSNNTSSFLSLRYDFTDWLYFQVRGGLTSGSSDWE
ncbi:MAG: SusC/RagA family TonB-linked outer membrane protein, partial [Mangrovibacterium sp.]|nr:SusC/RagA family TonB-linked outer membrane protein [Mangrovibacterium sp.]